MKILTTLRKNILRIARNKSPFLADCISGWKMYSYTKTHHGQEQNVFAEAFYGRKQPHVLGGPFKGMVYENRTYFGPVTPRWMGCYEKELHSVILSIKDYLPECVVDIGSAEGYYSIGLARMLPSANVFSYETNPLSIWQQRSLKMLNKVSNLQIRRYCSQEELCTYASKRSFILSDIEGCELDLFTEKVVVALANAVVLIELHCYREVTVESVTSTLEQRFAATHSIQYIAPEPRTAKDIEIEHPESFDKKSIVSAMNEYRSQPQKWMYCVPKNFR